MHSWIMPSIDVRHVFFPYLYGNLNIDNIVKVKCWWLVVQFFLILSMYEGETF